MLWRGGGLVWTSRGGGGGGQDGRRKIEEENVGVLINKNWGWDLGRGSMYIFGDPSVCHSGALIALYLWH